MKKSFNIQELLHCKSKSHGTKPMHSYSSSSRAFQRQQENDLKHTGLVDLITTKQNKLPSFIDRLLLGILVNGPTWQIWEKKTLPMTSSRVFFLDKSILFCEYMFSKKLLCKSVFLVFSSPNFNLFSLIWGDKLSDFSIGFEQNVKGT